MPSKLPVIKANTTQENISKMGIIAKAHKRSVSKELEFLIENHIAQYEQEHGEIKICKINVDLIKENSDRMKFRSKVGGKEE